MAADTYLKALGLGFLTGGRSMSGPALLSNHLSGDEPAALSDSPLHLFSAGWLSNLLKVAAVGEMVADKLPLIPARTEPAPLAGRIVLGAFTGLLLCVAERRSPVVGALLGGVGALVGTFAFYHLRRLAGEQSPIADPVLGLAEDAVIVGSGMAILNGE